MLATQHPPDHYPFANGPGGNDANVKADGGGGGGGGVPAGEVRQAGDGYKYSSEPKAAIKERKKYKDPYAEEKTNMPVNIMYDRRIHRGSTYASPVLPVTAQPDPVKLHRQNEIKRRLRARRKAEMQRRPKTPEPVPGRKHMDVQTELYLEELTDAVPEAYAETQTDAFLDRAPSPFYIPQKSGVDAETQIYEGELFDFNYEVEPILEVLVGKTLEQAVMEVVEEEELATLKKHQEEYEAMRAASLVETQRLEAAERRRTEEKERRVAEQLRILKDKQDVAAKVAARAFAKSYLADLVPGVFASLEDNGYFYDTVEREIESQFLPWLSAEVVKKVRGVNDANLLLDDIIKYTIFRMRNGC